MPFQQLPIQIACQGFCLVVSFPHVVYLTEHFQLYIYLNKLSMSFAAILYQEYSDVAINREIQRQQGKEPGTEEEGLRDEGSDGTPSPSNLSPSSSFRSSRGSAFALWQDIPDVRTSGQLDFFSNEERRLQEVTLALGELSDRRTCTTRYQRMFSVIVNTGKV